MDAQYTENTLVALVAPWPFPKLNLHKMTSDGSETYANVFKMSRILKINYHASKLVENTRIYGQNSKLPNIQKKNSTKCGDILVKPNRIGYDR